MGLVRRAQNIIFRPRAEWDIIAQEPVDVGGTYRHYIVPLSLAATVASFVGTSIIGFPVPGLPTFRVPLLAGLVANAVQFVLGLGLVYALALVIDYLSPHFAGRRGMGQAFKLAAFGLTPVWVANLFALVPALTILSLLGLYFVYVLYLGLKRLMTVPPDRALLFTVVVSAITFLMALVVSGIAGLFMPAAFRPF